MNKNYTKTRIVFLSIFLSLFIQSSLLAQVIIPATITSNLTITSDAICHTDCVVKNGAVLTINGANATFMGNLQVDQLSKVVFNNANIKIQNNKEIKLRQGGTEVVSGFVLLLPGGELESKYSIITSLDPSGFWTGIRSYKSVHHGTGYGLAGKVNFISGKVERAIIGYKNVTTDGLSTSIANLPGRIRANGTTFRDNLESALDLSGYTTIPVVVGGGIDNMTVDPAQFDSTASEEAVFTNCTFEYTVNLNSIPNALVNIRSCIYIPFFSCTFRGVMHPTPYSVVSSGVGIRALNSNIHIAKASQTNNVPKFENLAVGVHLFDRNLNNERTIIRDADFYCQYGIQLNDSKKALIVNNKFFKSNFTVLDYKHIGITLMNSSGFRVEGNRFDYIMNYQDTGYVGIVVQDCGIANNEIYRNYFRKTNYGIQSVGQNKNNTGSTGLRFLCNNFADDAESVFHRYDISVMKDPKLTGINNPPQGVNHSQGNDMSLATVYDMRSAGNRFNQQPNPNANSARHFYMQPGTFALLPAFRYHYKEIPNNNIELPKYRSANLNLIDRPQFDCPTKAYKATPAFLALPTSWETKLLVVEYAIDSFERVEGDADILGALYTYHSKLIDSVLEWHTPEGQIAVLEQVSKNYAFKVDLAHLYKAMGNYKRATDILRVEIAKNFALQPAEETALNHLADLYEVQQWLENNQNDWRKLESAIKAKVAEYANLNEVYATGTARALLANYEGNIYLPEYVPITSDEENSFILGSTVLAKSTWTLHPNPAKNLLNIGWMGTGELAEIELFDLTGNRVLSQKLARAKNNVDIKMLATGIYIARLKIDGKQQPAIKFVKQ